MFAEVSQTLIDIGTIAGIIVAIIAACAAVSRLAVVKWLWSRIIGQPITAWLDRVVRGITDPIAADLSTLTVDHAALKVTVTEHMEGEADARKLDIQLRRLDTDDRRARQLETDARFEHVGSELDQWRTETRGVVAKIETDVADIKTDVADVKSDVAEVKRTMITKRAE